MSADVEVRERLARIEGILSQMDKRLNHVETEIQRLHQRMDRLEDRMDRLRESLTARIDRLFKWMVTLLASIWVTVIASLLPLILKLLALL